MLSISNNLKINKFAFLCEKEPLVGESEKEKWGWDYIFLLISQIFTEFDVKDFGRRTLAKRYFGDLNQTIVEHS